MRKNASVLEKQQCVTVTLDGFKNVRRESVLGVMVVVRADDKVQNVLLSTENIATQSYKAEDVIVKVKTAMKTLKEQYGAVVQCVTCDSEAAHIKGRRLLGEKHSSMIFVACNAHQVNSVVKDSLKVLPTFVTTARRAVVISTSLAKSDTLLGVLGEEQVLLHKKTTAISKPTETRWYSFYNTFLAIKTSRVPLQAAARKSPNCPVAFAAVVEDDAFWASLNRMTDLLKPLVIAQRRAESGSCSLADVGNIFADIYDAFCSMPADMAAIERGWSQLPYVHVKHRTTLRLSTATALAAMRRKFQQGDREKAAVAALRDVPKTMPLFELEPSGDFGLVAAAGLSSRDDPLEGDEVLEGEIDLFLAEQSEVAVMDEEELVDTLTDFYTLTQLFGKSGG